MWFGDMTVKASDHCNRQARFLFFISHLLFVFYLFITTLRMIANLDITILINLSNRNAILNDVLSHLHSIFNSQTITTANPTLKNITWKQDACTIENSGQLKSNRGVISFDIYNIYISYGLDSKVLLTDRSC